MQPSPQTATVVLRCAIYTRKSTEEGLEQEFNSLEAQRECAEAYILSQRAQNWTVIPTRYDDGGFTGANLDRPALQQLLGDVEAGRMECVVVYKVDRLSRSLLDFARIMEVFEKRKVSFVSVTQQLNTTSPMGRLTLNVLLSFAQFEREIVSERTRDKISAARRKGKWTGGIVPLGYDADPVSRKLVVNPAEAQQVRNIFSIFLEQQSLQGALEHIGSRGDRTKSGVTRKGRRYEGTPFDRPALVRLLTNVLYVGDVWHGGIVYPGEQEAIVDRQVWTRANELLQAQKREPNGRIRERRGALLQGRLECGVCGKPMLHGYTTKRGRRYRYYLCLTARRKGAKACPDQMIAARRIEHGVLAALQELGCEGETAQPSHEMIERARYDHRSGLVLLHLREGSELGKARHIEVDVRKPVLVSKCEPAGETEEPPVARITGMMALAIRFESLLEQGAAKNHRQLARLAKVSPARIAQLLKLTHLAPAIQEQLLFLKGPAPKFQEPALRRIADELSWTKQLKLFEELCA